VLKEKNYHPRILKSARVSFISEGEITSFSDKPKLREFPITRLTLQEMLKEVLQLEVKGQ
jgi:hypothetical protein